MQTFAVIFLPHHLHSHDSVVSILFKKTDAELKVEAPMNLCIQNLI